MPIHEEYGNPKRIHPLVFNCMSCPIKFKREYSHSDYVLLTSSVYRVKCSSTLCASTEKSTEIQKMYRTKSKCFHYIICQSNTFPLIQYMISS